MIFFATHGRRSLRLGNTVAVLFRAGPFCGASVHGSPPPRDCMPSMIFVLHVCVMVCTIFGSITNAVYVQVFSIVQHRTISAELAAPALQLPHGGQKKHFQQMNVVFSVNACGLAAEAMHCVVAFMGPEHIFYNDPYIVLGSGALPFQADPARPLTHLSLLAFPRLLNPLIFSQGSHPSDTSCPAYLSQPGEIFSVPNFSDVSARSSL